MAAVLVLFSWYSRPSEAQLKAQRERDSIAAAQLIEEQKQAEAKQKARDDAAATAIVNIGPGDGVAAAVCPVVGFCAKAAPIDDEFRLRCIGIDHERVVRGVGKVPVVEDGHAPHLNIVPVDALATF